MTTLHNEITIEAPRSEVWRSLTRLDALGKYDPGVKSATLVGQTTAGQGAQRRCELRPAGWFVEQVVTWEPESALSFQLVDCSLPVSSLRHDYTLTETGGRTHLTQVMTYQLKYGPLGRTLDVLGMRRKWDAGIKAFLVGLKAHVEAGDLANEHT